MPKVVKLVKWWLLEFNNSRQIALLEGLLAPQF